MAGDYSFPDEALSILRRARWRPWALPIYDGMSGGSYWSDEFSRAAIDRGLGLNCRSPNRRPIAWLSGSAPRGGG